MGLVDWAIANMNDNITYEELLERLDTWTETLKELLKQYENKNGEQQD